MLRNVIIPGSRDLHTTARATAERCLMTSIISKPTGARHGSAFSPQRNQDRSVGCVEFVPYRLQLVPEVGLEPTRRLTDPRV